MSTLQVLIIPTLGSAGCPSPHSSRFQIASNPFYHIFGLRRNPLKLNIGKALPSQLVPSLSLSLSSLSLLLSLRMKKTRRRGATFPACAIVVIIIVIVVIVIVVVVVVVIVVVVEDEEDGDVTTRCHLPSLCHRLVGNLWSD